MPSFLKKGMIMKSGGSVAIRGFLVQTLIALLDTLEDKPPWTSVTLEPDVDSEKIDILWKYKDKTKAVQVKSSQNPFTKNNIRRWAKELKDHSRSASSSLQGRDP